MESQSWLTSLPLERRASPPVHHRPGRQSDVCDGCRGGFLSPLRGWPASAHLPRAYALGCNLSPLRGWGGADQMHICNERHGAATPQWEAGPLRLLRCATGRDDRVVSGQAGGGRGRPSLHNQMRDGFRWLIRQTTSGKLPLRVGRRSAGRARTSTTVVRPSLRRRLRGRCCGRG